MLEFSVLGPLTVRRYGAPVTLGPPRVRQVLAALLMDAGRTVPVERLIDLLWGEQPPPTARAGVHVCLSRVRRILDTCGGTAAVTTTGLGYRLDIDLETVDVFSFRRLVEEARSTADPGQAGELLRAALALWRDRPLVDLAEPVRAALCAGLEAERLDAQEERIAADLRAGRHDGLVIELSALVQAYPLRERLRESLMLALHRSSRTSEALELFRNTRRLFADELGVEPGVALRELHQSILRSDTSLAAVSGTEPERERTAPAQLPPDLTTFTGRAAELRRVLEHDRHNAAVVTIDGMAGVGKTSLAVHAGHLLAGDYPDGQLFLNLRGFTRNQEPVDPLNALERMLRAFGVPAAQLPAELDDRAALLRSEIAGRRVLVVLDNAGDEAHVRPLLPGTPGCLVLVTSRRRLTGLDDSYPVSLDVLPEADAIGLLTAVVGLDRLAGEPAVRLADTVRQCGRLPLAIRIAGSRLVSRPQWTLGELVERLRDHEGRLDELDAGERGVAMAFRMSYRQLDDEQRQLFRLLGLHPGPHLDARATAALTGWTARRTRRLLESLLDVHLLQQFGPRRYALHDLVHTFAAERAEAELSADDQLAARSRLYDHYCATALRAVVRILPSEEGRLPRLGTAPDAAAPLAGPTAARTWLDVERVNLVAVASAAARYGFADHVTALARTVMRHLQFGGHYGDALAITRFALQGARQSGDLAAEAAILHNMGTMLGRLNRIEEAQASLTEALPLHRGRGDLRGEAATLNSLGLVLRTAGRYQHALEHLLRSIDLYQRLDDNLGMAGALCNVGSLQEELGHYPQALHYLRRALAARRLAGDGAGESVTLLNLGTVYCRLGRLKEAMDHLRRSLDMNDEIGDHVNEAYVLTRLGEVHRRSGRVAEAVGCHERALAIADETGDAMLRTAALDGFGATMRAAGDLDRADRLYESALHTARRTGVPLGTARVFDGAAQVARANGQPDRARRYWQEAYARYTALGLPRALEVREQLDRLEATVRR